MNLEAIVNQVRRLPGLKHPGVVLETSEQTLPHRPAVKNRGGVPAVALAVAVGLSSILNPGSARAQDIPSGPVPEAASDGAGDPPGATGVENSSEVTAADPNAGSPAVSEQPSSQRLTAEAKVAGPEPVKAADAREVPTDNPTSQEQAKQKTIDSINERMQRIPTPTLMTGFEGEGNRQEGIDMYKQSMALLQVLGLEKDASWFMQNTSKSLNIPSTKPNNPRLTVVFGLQTYATEALQADPRHESALLVPFSTEYDVKSDDGPSRAQSRPQSLAVLEVAIVINGVGVFVDGKTASFGSLPKSDIRFAYWALIAKEKARILMEDTSSKVSPGAIPGQVNSQVQDKDYRSGLNLRAREAAIKTLRESLPSEKRANFSIPDDIASLLDQPNLASDPSGV
jgi:hypothetical protein